MMIDDDDDDDDDERKKERKMKRTRAQNKSRSEFAHTSLYLSSNNSHRPSFPLLLSTCTHDTRISLN